MIFCDWLDVTFAAGTAPLPELGVFFAGLEFEAMDTRDTRVMRFRRPGGGYGMAEFLQTGSWDRVSVSGAICVALREASAWVEFLTVLAEVPHTITRLDAALDLPVDGADLVAAMRERYPETVNFGRKALQTTLLLQTRPDGRETGTWYGGRLQKAKVSARVYDKAWEALCNRGEELLPTGRVELTFRKGYGATLRDAAYPAGIFWEAASPVILTAPEGVPVRVHIDDYGWKSPPRTFDPALVLRRRVEALAELQVLALVADELGVNGRRFLLDLIGRQVLSNQPSSGDSAPDVSTSSA